MGNGCWSCLLYNPTNMAVADDMETLGIEGDLTPGKLRSKFKEFAWAHHPDRGGDAEIFKKLYGAYKRLLEYITPPASDSTPPASDSTPPASDSAPPENTFRLSALEPTDPDALKKLVEWLMGHKNPLDDWERAIMVHLIGNIDRLMMHTRSAQGCVARYFNDNNNTVSSTAKLEDVVARAMKLCKIFEYTRPEFRDQVANNVLPGTGMTPLAYVLRPRIEAGDNRSLTLCTLQMVFLVSEGADPDKGIDGAKHRRRTTPFHLAASKPSVLIALLLNSLPEKLRVTRATRPNKFGHQPIHFAAFYRRDKVVELLWPYFVEHSSEEERLHLLMLTIAGRNEPTFIRLSTNLELDKSKWGQIAHLLRKILKNKRLKARYFPQSLSVKEFGYRRYADEHRVVYTEMLKTVAIIQGKED